MRRVMLHFDMNNYFASVESIDKPEMHHIPMAVCGDAKMRHGIVLSKNDEAKKYGILTGESSYTAKTKCPHLVILKPDYRKYLSYAKKAREIFLCYSDKIYPYGLDEAWVDMTEKCGDEDDGMVVADEVRKRIKEELKLTVSVGVSFNYVFSKLASDMKKPDAVTVIPFDDFMKTVRNIPAFDMLFVGASTRKVLRSIGILTIGELAKADPVLLGRRLGKKGYMLRQFANGDDSSFNPCTDIEEEIKSIGNCITPPKDIDNENDACAFIYLLACSVGKRLVKHLFTTSCITITLRFSDFSIITRQKSFKNATDSPDAIFGYAYHLYQDNKSWNKNIRSIGVRAHKLVSRDCEQLFLLDTEDKDGISGHIKDILEEVKKKFCDLELEKSATTRDFDITLF